MGIYALWQTQHLALALSFLRMLHLALSLSCLRAHATALAVGVYTACDIINKSSVSLMEIVK